MREKDSHPQKKRSGKPDQQIDLSNQENWVPTDAERATQAEAQLQQVTLNLLQQGMTLEQVVQLTGLSLEQVQGIANER